MKQYTNQPIFFEGNRVFRVYKGGYLFGDFMGSEKVDSNFPEEWVASTVHALNENGGPRDGLSIVQGTDVTLKELIEEYPREMLGDREKFDVLVKYLDSGIRLPMQVHPDREYSEKYFSSSYGKTEMWMILAVREDAGICFGFKDELTKEEFSDIVERSKHEKDIMDRYLNKVSVKPGEVYLIPAKAVHAIGYGCLILEVQEPTDFTIQPEYWCGDYELSEKEMYLGLPKDTALDCFDYSLFGEDCISLSKKIPTVVSEDDRYKKETVITPENTPCFAVNRYTVKTEMVLEIAPAIYVVSEGQGNITGENYRKEVKKGDYFFLPSDAKSNYYINADQKIELIECLPPS